jgi:hypothetical protein
LLGFDPSESPWQLDRGLVCRPLDAPLGFLHRLTPERSGERLTGIWVHLASCRTSLPTTDALWRTLRPAAAAGTDLAVPSIRARSNGGPRSGHCRNHPPNPLHFIVRASQSSIRSRDRCRSEDFHEDRSPFPLKPLVWCSISLCLSDYWFSNIAR